MEEIIEVFADSISGFIMLSIKLQEQNVAPSPPLRPAAEGVVQIAREKGRKEYADYEEIQADIFDCVTRVEAALDKFPVALNILFRDQDRADGWRKLVQATQAIASQTSRLLLVVFGAEHRRLQAAGEALLASCAAVKRQANVSDAQLATQAKLLVDATNKTSSDLMIFNSYVQARAKETEGPKQRQLADAVGTFSTHNQNLVNQCNALLKGISQTTRAPFVRTVDDVAALTRKILDLLTPPENLDIFKVIQDLYNKGNMAVLTGATPLDSVLANPSGRDVSIADLLREGAELKRAVQPVRGHRGVREREDVANNTNVASAKAAKYNNLLADFIACDKIPALKSTLSSCHADMNGANEQLVRTTNDYIATLGGGEALKLPSRSHATPARNAPGAAAAHAKPAVTAAAKKVVLATSQAVKAGADRGQFVPAARDASEAYKQLLAAVDSLAAHAPAQSGALKAKAAAVRQQVVNTVMAGKGLLANPSNSALQTPVQTAGSAVARAVKDLLASVNQAGGGGGHAAAPATASGPAAGDQVGKSAALTGACQRIEDIVDKVNAELNPRSTLGTHATVTNSVSQQELDATAEEVLRRIRELRGYPAKTPKEVATDSDTLSNVTAKFAKQLEARGRQVNPALGRQLADFARQIDPPANKAVVDAVNQHLAAGGGRAAPGVDRAADHLEQLVRATMDACKPKVQLGGGAANKALPAQVTPVHIRDAAEQMKADNRPVHDYANLAPQALADAAGTVHGDATYLGKLLDKYAGDVKQPALKQKLASDADRLADAKAELVRATNAYAEAPDQPARRGDLEAAATRIDELADEIVATVLPTDALKRAPPANVGGHVTSDDVERGAKELIAAEDKLAEFRDMTPEEAVAAANDASGKAATFAAQLEGRGKQVPQPKLQAALRDAARDIDRLNDAQHDAVRAHLENPADAGRQRALDDSTKAINDRVRAVLDELLPQASKERRAGPHAGKVSPADIEREGRDAQRRAANAKQHGSMTPKELVGAVDDAFAQLDKLDRMLEAMEGQPETRVATKAAIQKARDKLAADADALVDAANAHVRAPEDAARGRAVDDAVQRVHADIDQVIADVKPKATVAKATGQAGAVTPADIVALGKQVQAGARDVQAFKQHASPQQTVDKTEATSALAAKFSDAVLARAKQDKRPGVADMLRAAAPKVDAANKRMVEATNAYTADPASGAAQAEVEAATNELIDVVQDVLDQLVPPPTAAQSNPDYSKQVSRDDVERNARDLRAAVLEVKKFPNKSPKATSADVTDASAKLVRFCDDLLVRAKHCGNAKHAAVLQESAAKLMRRNPELLSAANAYLADPDDPATGADLDGVCDLILGDLDDVMAAINPRVKIEAAGDYRDGQKVTPEDLEALGDKVKRRCSVVEAFNNMTAAELAAAANDACGSAEDFRKALKARGAQVANAGAKKHLNDGAALIERRNRELEAAANAHLAAPGDKAAQKALADACQAMKDAVDEVLGRVRPRVAQAAEPSVGDVKPSDLDVTCEQVIKAATDLQGFKNDSPVETRDKAADTSAKAAKYAAQVKALAAKQRDPATKQRLDDAYADLVDANEGVVAATNDYLGDPDSAARQDELHEAAENLKRAARAALAAARPRVDMSGDIPHHAGPVAAGDLRDAADALKRAVKPLRTPDGLAPDALKDDTENTNAKALAFLGLAQAKARDAKDPAQKAALSKIVDELNRERRQLGDKANARLGDPTPATNAGVKQSADRIDALVDQFMAAARPKAQLTRPAPGAQAGTDLDSLDAAAEAAKKAVRRLDAGADNAPDDDEVVGMANDASAKVARFAEHVAALQKETDDKELQAKLKKALNALADDNKALVGKTNAFVGEREPAARAALGESCAKTIRDIDRAMHDIRDAMKPKTFEDEIDEAALDIQEAVDEFALVPPELRELAMRLADLMRRLAEAARQGDKAGMISISKEIATITKEIVKLAKPYAEGCRDPSLADSIYVGNNALGNFSTQLKILAAVKAASIGRDPAAESQLVACCDGISNSLRASLEGVQSAKLSRK